MAGETGISTTMGSAEWALLIILSVLWGGSFFFAEVALAELGPLTVVLGRVAIAAMALIVLTYAMGSRLPADTRLWGAFLVMGALNNLIPFSLIVWGQTQITGGLASILNGTTPLFTVVLAHFLTRDEKMTVGRFSGVILGILGVAVMIGPVALEGLGVHVIAQVAVLGAAVSYGFAAIFGRRFKGTPPLVTATGQVTATTVMMLPVALLVEQPWTLPAPGPATWGAVAGLGLLSTAAAYVIYFRILARAGATNLSLVTFLIPISAILLGAIILGERLDPGQIFGTAIIGLGLAAMDGRPLRFLQVKL